MRRLISTTTLVLSLIGIGAGAGGILLAPSAAETTLLDIHLDESANCLEGCDTGQEICCAEEKEP